MVCQPGGQSLGVYSRSTRFSLVLLCLVERREWWWRMLMWFEMSLPVESVIRMSSVEGAWLSGEERKIAFGMVSGGGIAAIVLSAVNVRKT